MDEDIKCPETFETDSFDTAAGTDFTLIAQLFPKRDRKHIKNKYNKEIKTMPSMVNEALIGGKNPEETKELFEVILSNQRAAAAAGAIEN